MRARKQYAVLGALLGVTLLVTGVLTFEGQRALRDHRQAVERVLRDNAAFAAFRYTDITISAITSYFRIFYGPLKDTPAPNLSAVLFPDLVFPRDLIKQCACDPTRHLTGEFAYDYASDSLVMRSGTLSAAEKQTLVRILRNQSVVMLQQGWQMALAHVEDGPRGGVVGFAVRQDLSEKAPRQYAYGFLGNESTLRESLLHLKDLHKVMPSSDSTSTQNRFALRVESHGKPILEEGPESRFEVQRVFGQAFAGLTVRVSIDSAAVPAMAGSALPQTRFTILIGLMLMASIMIGAALVLTKRQTELAATREDFVSSVSHELRTPLAQIRMFAETLLLGRVRNEVERRRSLEIIDQESKRLTALVENVLTLSRAERGSARLAPAATELAPAIREVVESFGQMPRSRTAEYRLELEDRLVATVDPGALRQIVLNLLDNAIKYGPSGQRVSVGLAMFEEHARLWVDDEGPGIPQRDRERVFEMFYRTSNHLASDAAGSGIGLAVVRELAGLLGGRAWVDDAPGGGARLVVEFPEAYLRAEEAAGSWAVA